MRAPIHRLAAFPFTLLLLGLPTFADEVVPAGGEFVVNSTTSADQGYPEIATNGAGTFVATWESFGQDGDLFGIFGQLLTAAGEPMGSEFPVNSTITGNQFDPAAAMHSDGTFVVTWASDGQDGSGFGIFGQRFDASGGMVGDEFQVSTTTAADQNYPDIAMRSDGSFLVVWESHGQDGSFAGVYGQRYDAAGDPVGDELMVNTTTQEEQDEVAVIATAEGWVVVWESGGNDTSGDAVMMQRLDADGLPLGDETQVNTSITSDQEDADIARLADGTFAVVWESDGQDGDGETVVAQVFAADGSPIGGEIQLNTTTLGDQRDPRIAPVGTDAFLVIWTGDVASASITDIFGRQLDAVGNPVGDEFRVNTSTADEQDRAALAGDSTGQVISAWRAFGGHDGDLAGVLAQRFDLALFADGFESGGTLGWDSVVPSVR